MTRISTYEEFVDFARQPGAIVTVRDPDWLLKGCPKCGGTSWGVTSDCWAYCDGCAKGYSTAYPFTKAGESYSVLAPTPDTDRPSDKAVAYWIETLRGWAEDRLSDPQFAECEAVLNHLLEGSNP